MKSLTYTAEHLAWMEKNRTLSKAELHARFEETFRIQASLEGLARKRQLLGWKRGRCTYTSRHLAWMEANRALSLEEFHEQFQRQFLTTVSMEGLYRKRLSLGWKPKCPNRGWFVKGDPRRFTEGRDGCRSSKSLSIGAEVIRNGVWHRKVSENKSRNENWQPAHKLRREDIHGKIPDGMVLVSKGDKLNTSPDKWELVSLSMLIDLNGTKGCISYRYAPNDLKSTILGVAKLKHVLRYARRDSTAP